MNDLIPIRSFPTYEDARTAALKLEAENISSRLDDGQAGPCVSILVASDRAEEADAILGQAGFEPPPALDEVEGQAQEPVEEDGSSEKTHIDDVEDELRKMAGRKKGLLGNLGTLIFTLALFVMFGLFSATVSGVLTIVLVLLVHELGHFVGMKLFKYRDVQMFFIPFFGAAVSGSDTDASGARKAIVALLGPLPGIVLGIVLAVVYVRTAREELLEAVRALLFINVFNLLPFHPLDGGRFLDHVLFSRNPKIEVVFKVLAALALAGIAYLLKSILLGVFAFMMFTSLRWTHLTAKLAGQIRKEIGDRSGLSPQHVPRSYLERVVPVLREAFSGQMNTIGLVARYAQSIWMKVCEKPPSVAATIGLLLVYLLTACVGVVSPFLFEGIVYAMSLDAVIEERMSLDGETVCVEVQFAGEAKVSEIELDEQGRYHGSAIYYAPGGKKMLRRGCWKEGCPDGKWPILSRTLISG